MESNKCPGCSESVVLVDSKSSSIVIVCKKCSLIQDVPMANLICSACSSTRFERVDPANAHFHYCPKCRKVVKPTPSTSEINKDIIKQLSKLFTQP